MRRGGRVCKIELDRYLLIGHLHLITRGEHLLLRVDVVDVVNFQISNFKFQISKF